MKTYTSGGLAQTFIGTRAEAIRSAEKYLKEKAKNADLRGKHYRWNADDGSGFVYEITTSGEVRLDRKINAERRF